MGCLPSTVMGGAPVAVGMAGAVAARVAVGDGVGVRPAVGAMVGVGEGLGAVVGVAVGAGVRVGVAVRVGDGVGVKVGVAPGAHAASTASAASQSISPIAATFNASSHSLPRVARILAELAPKQKVLSSGAAGSPGLEGVGARGPRRLSAPPANLFARIPVYAMVPLPRILAMFSSEKNSAGDSAPAFIRTNACIACWSRDTAANSFCISGGGGSSVAS